MDGCSFFPGTGRAPIANRRLEFPANSATDLRLLNGDAEIMVDPPSTLLDSATENPMFPRRASAASETADLERGGVEGMLLHGKADDSSPSMSRRSIASTTSSLLDSTDGRLWEIPEVSRCWMILALVVLASAPVLSFVLASWYAEPTGLTIVQVVVMGKLLPNVFTVILWGSFMNISVPHGFYSNVSTFKMGRSMLQGDALAAAHIEHSSMETPMKTWVSKRWMKVLCAFSLLLYSLRALEHGAYQSFEQHKYARSHENETVVHFWIPDRCPNSYPNAHWPDEKSCLWSTTNFYLRFIEFLLEVMGSVLFLVGIDAVCVRFEILTERLALADHTMQIMRYSITCASDVGPTATIVHNMKRLQKTVKRIIRYRGNVLFSVIVASLTVLLLDAVVFVYSELNCEGTSQCLRECHRWRADDIVGDDRANETIVSDAPNNDRCIVIWTIFLVPICVWTLWAIPYLRALHIAIKFNSTIDELLLASLEYDNHEEAAKITNYLASLHELGKLHIAPFGIKLSYTNVLQALIGASTAFTQVTIAILKLG